jgi:integrase
LSAPGRSVAASPDRGPRHATEGEYAAFLREHGTSASSAKTFLQDRKRFVRRYPRIKDWFAAPLPERVGRLCGKARDTPVEGRHAAQMTSVVCYKARSYLLYLATSGLANLDWEWVVAVPRLRVWGHLAHVGLDAAVEEMADEAEGLGYARPSAVQGLRWAVGRIYLRTIDPDVGSIGDAELEELEGALRSFAGREDRDLYFGSNEGYRGFVRTHVTHLHLLRVVLYHRGQAHTEPRKGWTVRNDRPGLKPEMQEAMDRYLAARRLTDRPNTVYKIERGLRVFAGWLGEAYPEVASFAEVDRDHVLDFAEALEEIPGETTGEPLAPLTRRNRLSALSVFFRDTADWGWEGVPGRPLLGVGDMPKISERVPRYIPEEELGRLMAAVRALPCPYQRAALLVARWSGARRDEIRRLEVDCLDSYPDGTPRLRIPAGKTKKERVVPLNEEAAEAVREVRKDRLAEGARGFRDELTGVVTRRLFMHHGKPFSCFYLFHSPLEKACRAAGLLDGEGKPTVTAHRFRHTVGKQLAERGARLNTIMKVLGHDSASMSMVYARISDEEVLKDYRAVLGPGATIAGPLAETLRSGRMPPSDVEWLKANFFETELELGRCLRLPQEGPCECDLYLNCAKFVTTAEYAPRLRSRRQREFGLIDDAVSNGWKREAERHRCTVRRIEQLLSDLGEPLEADGAVG